MQRVARKTLSSCIIGAPFRNLIKSPLNVSRHISVLSCTQSQPSTGSADTAIPEANEKEWGTLWFPQKQKCYSSLLSSAAAAPRVGWFFVLFERPPVSRFQLCSLLLLCCLLWDTQDPDDVSRKKCLVLEGFMSAKIIKLRKRDFKRAERILVFIGWSVSGCCFLSSACPIGGWPTPLLHNKNSDHQTNLKINMKRLNISCKYVLYSLVQKFKCGYVV